MDGISAMHGGHQVAQMFTKTFLPFRSARFRILPFASLTEKEGNKVSDVEIWESFPVIFSCPLSLFSAGLLMQDVITASVIPTNAIIFLVILCLLFNEKIIINLLAVE
jgi:hypothetical protein